MKFFTFQRSLIMSLLTLLGFASACSDKESDVVMYASPYAKYSIRARVIDTKGNAIPDIKVSYKDVRPDSYPILNPTITDQNGTSRVVGSSFPIGQMVVSFEDIDGEQNGLFANKDTTLDVKLVKKNGDNNGGFYRGSYDTDFTITLKNK